MATLPLLLLLLRPELLPLLFPALAFAGQRDVNRVVNSGFEDNTHGEAKRWSRYGEGYELVRDVVARDGASPDAGTLPPRAPAGTIAVLARSTTFVAAAAPVAAVASAVSVATAAAAARMAAAALRSRRRTRGHLPCDERATIGHMIRIPRRAVILALASALMMSTPAGPKAAAPSAHTLDTPVITPAGESAAPTAAAGDGTAPSGRSCSPASPGGAPSRSSCSSRGTPPACLQRTQSSWFRRDQRQR